MKAGGERKMRTNREWRERMGGIGKLAVKKPHLRKYDAAKFLAAVLLLACAFSMTADAAAAQMTAKVNKIYDIVLAIIQAAGGIVLAWGIFDFATAYQAHDTSQQTQSLKKVVSGILMIMAGTLVTMLK